MTWTCGVLSSPARQRGRVGRLEREADRLGGFGQVDRLRLRGGARARRLPGGRVDARPAVWTVPRLPSAFIVRMMSAWVCGEISTAATCWLRNWARNAAAAVALGREGDHQRQRHGRGQAAGGDAPGRRHSGDEALELLLSVRTRCPARRQSRRSRAAATSRASGSWSGARLAINSPMTGCVSDRWVTFLLQASDSARGMRPRPAPAARRRSPRRYPASPRSLYRNSRKCRSSRHSRCRSGTSRERTPHFGALLVLLDQRRWAAYAWVCRLLADTLQTLAGAARRAHPVEGQVQPDAPQPRTDFVIGPGLQLRSVG